jgi:hypothetical protein
MDLANALEKKLGAGLLQEDATGAQLHRLHELGLVVRRGQYNNSGFRRGIAQFAQNRQSIQIWNLQIEQQDIRPILSDYLRNLGAIASFGHDLEVLIACQ